MGSRLLLAAASFAVLAACSDNKPAAPAAETAAVAPKPPDDPAWPVAAVADPTTLGFTAEGLAALD
ncbi:MAG: class A beta-lactamase, partial [Alphaproteobacteria bacterium]